MVDGTRPKILVVTRNLPPLVGGMERLNLELVRSLADWAEVRVIGPNGAAEALSPIPVTEIALKPLARFLGGAGLAAVREARRWKPDIVLAGSGLMAPVVTIAAFVAGAASAAYVHGLDIVARHPVYRLLWRPALRGIRTVIANSRATADCCAAIGIDPRVVRIVHPGTTLPAVAADADAARAARMRLGIEGAPLLLSVGRLTRRKGLLEFVADVLPKLVAIKPEAKLLVVGSAPVDALNRNEASQAMIERAAAAQGVEGNLRFLGQVSDAELDDLFSAADVHVFPVRVLEGDPEGFGMVAIEAASRGLPTVAYAAGGVVDAVGPGRSGLLVPPGDARKFCEAILEALSARAALRESSREFARGFSWAHFGDRVRAVLSQRP